jgi:hypothetical protein
MPLLPPLAEILHAAGGLVAAVIEGRNFDAVLARAGLTGHVRAASMDLAYGTLRAFGRGDFILGRCSNVRWPRPRRADCCWSA